MQTFTRRIEVAFYYFLIGSALIGNGLNSLEAFHRLY